MRDLKHVECDVWEMRIGHLSGVSKNHIHILWMNFLWNLRVGGFSVGKEIIVIVR